MKLTIEKQPICTGEVSVIATAEQPIQCDVLLPDYYPDIARILCCSVTGIVTNTQSRGDKLNIDGMAVVDVCYCSENSEMRSTQYRVPFSRAVQLREGYNVGAVDVQISSTTTTCRAISRRRMDITSTLSIIVRVCDTKEVEAVCSADGMGVQVQNTEGTAAKIAAQLSRPIQLSDQFPLPSEIKPPLTIVSTNCRPLVEECKLVGGRVVVKGSLEMTILFQEKGQKKVCGLKHSLPLTSLIEAPAGVTNPQCDVSIRVISCEATYQGEYNPDKNEISVSAQLEADIKLYSTYQYKGVNDCYSTSFECNPTYQLMNLPQMDKVITAPISTETKMQLPEGVTEVTDVTMTPTRETATVEGGKIVASCRMLVTVLGRNAEQGFECFERQWEVKEALEAPVMDGKLEMLPNFQQDGLDFTVEGDMLILKTRFTIRGCPMFYKKVKMLTNIAVDQSRPVEQDITVGMMIYYPTIGEQIWDIAKRYNTNAALILQQNDLDSPIIQDSQPLIIPT